MNKTVKNIIFFTIIINCIINVYAYKGDDSCRQLLKSYINYMAGFNTINKGTYFMDMTVFTASNDLQGGDITVRTKYYINDKQGAAVNDQVSIYYDTIDFIMVDHRNKRIMINKAGKTQNIKNRMAFFTQLQQLIIDSCAIEACYEAKVDGRDCTYIVASLPGNLKAKYKISDYKFYMLKGSVQLYKLTIDYVSEYKWDKQTITYNEIDFDYKGWKKIPVRKRIFSEDNELLPKYNNYELINNH